MRKPETHTFNHSIIKRSDRIGDWDLDLIITFDVDNCGWLTGEPQVLRKEDEEPLEEHIKQMFIEELEEACYDYLDHLERFEPDVKGDYDYHRKKDEGEL